jgi:hypothetical protein
VCDRLEGQLATAQAESHRLLEAVLHHALLRNSDAPRSAAVHRISRRVSAQQSL